MDLKKEIIELLDSDFGFRSDIKRILGIDDIERELDEISNHS